MCFNKYTKNLKYVYTSVRIFPIQFFNRADNITSIIPAYSNEDVNVNPFQLFNISNTTNNSNVGEFRKKNNFVPTIPYHSYRISNDLSDEGSIATKQCKSTFITPLPKENLYVR